VPVREAVPRANGADRERPGLGTERRRGRELGPEDGGVVALLGVPVAGVRVAGVEVQPREVVAERDVVDRPLLEQVAGALVEVDVGRAREDAVVVEEGTRIGEVFRDELVVRVEGRSLVAAEGGEPGHVGGTRGGALSLAPDMFPRRGSATGTSPRGASNGSRASALSDRTAAERRGVHGARGRPPAFVGGQRGRLSTRGRRARTRYTRSAGFVATG
jgi:hypothetical protein